MARNDIEVFEIKMGVSTLYVKCEDYGTMTVSEVQQEVDKEADGDYRCSVKIVNMSRKKFDKFQSIR